MRKIFIGGAWPYANGSLHIGRIASLVPGDVLAKYHRQKGDDVLYVSGSDCHGTPIALRAKVENKDPNEIANYYHEEFVDCFNALGFTYDYYGKTNDINHINRVQEIFLDLYEKELLYKKKVTQDFCNNCEQFLPERYVKGICPRCGEEAKGDQCDHCLSLISSETLKDKECKICGSVPELRETEHFYLKLSKFQNILGDYLERQKINFRENAVVFTKKYLLEGLVDRAVTRDLDYGIEVPIEGYEDKKIYVWIEAVLGYLTTSEQWARNNDKALKDYWGEGAVSYYIHGKDNIPFHTIILPALLLGLGDYKLPDKIFSCEYLTLEKRKLSSSNNWAVWLPDLLEKYNPDHIRGYFIFNGPEKRDSDFSFSEFGHFNNSLLLGNLGNFINRTLKFIEKYYVNEIPKGTMDKGIKKEIENAYKNVGQLIEKGEFKKAFQEVFELSSKGNKYFDEEEPWITRNQDQQKCNDTIFTCFQLIVNLSNIITPFLPFTSKKIDDMINKNTIEWKYVQKTDKIKYVDHLFLRIDPKQIEREKKQLGLSC